MLWSNALSKSNPEKKGNVSSYSSNMSPGLNKTSFFLISLNLGFQTVFYIRKLHSKAQLQDAGSPNHSNTHSCPARNTNWKPAMFSADISSVTEGQINMSLAPDVSLSSSLSIVESHTSLRKAGVGSPGKGSQMFVLFH